MKHRYFSNGILGRAVSLFFCGMFFAGLHALPAAAQQTTGGTKEIVRERFEHLTTGFALEGAHINAACTTCHARQVFEGTPRTCSGCHLPGGPLATTAKPPFHLSTTQECSQCHDHYAWTGAFFVHGPATAGTCNHCHNGVGAQGKSAMHVPTSSQCDTCHRPEGWLPLALGSSSSPAPPLSTEREMLMRWSR